MSPKDGMKFLTDERVKVLAEKNGWSLPRAQGFVDGESYRRRAMAPGRHAQVGIDEYSLGFRAGYYERQAARSMPPKSPAAPVGKRLGKPAKRAQDL